MGLPAESYEPGEFPKAEGRNRPTPGADSIFAGRAEGKRDFCKEGTGGKPLNQRPCGKSGKCDSCPRAGYCPVTGGAELF